VVEKDEKDDKKEIRVGPGRPKLIWTGKPGRPKKQYNILGALVSKDVPIPATFKEAMSSPYASEWRDAMQREYDSLLANQTWQIADLPRNQRAFGCKWVFNVKRDKDGQIESFKARLVAKGCSQQYGVNYQETFSPVCRLESVRFILSLAAELGLYLHQMDVCTAYLNSDLSEMVYMKQQEGYIDQSRPEKSLLLKKAIYGLKQSGRGWNSMLDSTLVKLGFIACENEPCPYKQTGNGSLSLILVYVDDILLACQSKEDLLKIKSSISKSFECDDKGSLNLFLGMEIERDIKDSQYIKDLLHAHGTENCRQTTTPPQCKKIEWTKIQKTKQRVPQSADTTSTHECHLD